jgi:hypothetical protein
MKGFEDDFILKSTNFQIFKLPNFQISQMNIPKFPSINVNNPFPQQEMILRLNRIKNNYLTIFQQAAIVCNLPLFLLVAKSCVESGGLQQTSNNTYVGLMQIGKLTISDCLNYLQGKMYADGQKWAAPHEVVIPIVQHYFPSFSAQKGMVNMDAAFALAKSNTASGAAFNVLMGALYLHILCRNPKFIEGNTIRLDKVMSAYNTGPNYSFYKTPTADTSQLVQVIRNSKLSTGKKQETSAHILKFCGVGGAFDLLFNQKFKLT